MGTDGIVGMHLHPTTDTMDIEALNKTNIPTTYDHKGHPALDIAKFGKGSKLVDMLYQSQPCGVWLTGTKIELSSKVLKEIEL